MKAIDYLAIGLVGFAVYRFYGSRRFGNTSKMALDEYTKWFLANKEEFWLPALGALALLAYRHGGKLV